MLQVKNIDAVVVPVGGGGLIAGIALAVKSLYPHIQGSSQKHIQAIRSIYQFFKDKYKTGHLNGTTLFTFPSPSVIDVKLDVFEFKRIGGHIDDQ